MNQRNTLFYLHLTFNFAQDSRTNIRVYFLTQIEAIVSRALQIFRRFEGEKKSSQAACRENVTGRSFSARWYDFIIIKHISSSVVTAKHSLISRWVFAGWSIFGPVTFRPIALKQQCMKNQYHWWFPKKHYISDCVKVLKYNLPPKGGPATSVTATHKWKKPIPWDFCFVDNVDKTRILCHRWSNSTVHHPIYNKTC